MSTMQPGRAWVEIDLDALRANFQTLRRRVGARTAIIPMVKADAYGVGAERVAHALEPLEPWGYGVATAAEGVALRAANVTRPVVVFSPLPPGDAAMAAGAGLTASISDVGSLDRWVGEARALGRRLDFHVEIDTGMGRAGFDWRQTPEWADEVKRRMGPDVRWTGVFTHFQGADARGSEPTATQWQRFQDALLQLPVSREDLLVHACNSAAAMRWPQYAADAVRPGIFLYGGDPAPDVDEAFARPSPVVALRATVVRVREVPPGTSVGYGATHVARAWERWATLAIGYADGLPRRLGNVSHALVGGTRVPLVGRVSMDLTVLDVTGLADVAAGDVATLLGRDGTEVVTLEQMAAAADTIGYEILTRLGKRLPRIETQ